jgi:Phage phiEco32-like COOH.NH2 ligase-type 2
MSKLLVGADPELFFENSKGFVSIIGKLGGTKAKPLPIGNGCAVQEDNVAAEFNIPPADSAKAFADSIEYNLRYLENKAKEIGAQLSLKASAIFSREELACDAAWVFGCEPDYNAWTLDVNPKPKSEERNLRSAGGHVHLATEADPIATVRAMDLFIGAQLVAVDPDTMRRNLYGKAGAFRLKDYGVEYRTPSNYWISSRSLMEWVFNQCKKVKDFVDNGNTIESEHPMADAIQRCINESNKSLLVDINKYYGLQSIN